MTDDHKDEYAGKTDHEVILILETLSLWSKIGAGGVQMNLKKILMKKLDDELDELTDKALDKLMARTEDLDRLADLLLQKG